MFVCFISCFGFQNADYIAQGPLPYVVCNKTTKGQIAKIASLYAENYFATPKYHAEVDCTGDNSTDADPTGPGDSTGGMCMERSPKISTSQKIAQVYLSDL